MKFFRFTALVLLSAFIIGILNTFWGKFLYEYIIGSSSQTIKIISYFIVLGVIILLLWVGKRKNSSRLSRTSLILLFGFIVYFIIGGVFWFTECPHVAESDENKIYSEVSNEPYIPYEPPYYAGPFFFFCPFSPTY